MGAKLEDEQVGNEAYAKLSAFSRSVGRGMVGAMWISEICQWCKVEHLTIRQGKFERCSGQNTNGWEEGDKMIRGRWVISMAVVYRKVSPEASFRAKVQVSDICRGGYHSDQ